MFYVFYVSVINQLFVDMLFFHWQIQAAFFFEISS